MLLRGLDHRAARRDDGLATVWGVAWVAVCLTVGWLAVTATAIMSAQHHLDGAADLAAVSAAARLQSGGDACGVAERIAQANHAELAGCQVDGSDVVVSVAGSIVLPFGLDGGMTSMARAGP
ncbi:MAG: flp pilus-assembly TadE/G-like family protein [Propionibacteriales bacterium]|nr:flp pilus-assembly TadE/G-like family protein [Propionibacteriales bacterium]